MLKQVNRLQKTLEGANIKLAAVATDVLGKSGRDMIQALIDGETDAQALAELARGLLRKKLPQLQEALLGRVQPHHRTLLRHILAHIDFLESTLEQLLADIEAQLTPYKEERELLTSIPGIADTTAAIIIAEIGVDMEVFPSDKHLASWAGLCPGNRQSGGKRLSGAITGGNPYLRSVLTESWPGLFPIPKTTTYLPNIIVWPDASDERRRLLLWRDPHSGHHLSCLTDQETVH